METTPKTFIKFLRKKLVKKLLKEAKAVGYTIKKDDMSFEVLDPFYENALVFKGILMTYDVWAVERSESYSPSAYRKP